MPSILDSPSLPLRPPTAAAAPPSPQFRDFGDSAAIRQGIFDNVLKAAQSIEPVSNSRYALALENVAYDGPDKYTIAERKRALLTRGSLTRKLRGDWVLRDTAGQEISRKPSTLAKVPYITDSGTFINNGTAYTMGHQMRLRPGVFTRIMENGELESHVNVSKGLGHRLYLDPKTGVFRVKFGQARIPLVPLMRAMGATDQELRDTWGNDLAAVNFQKEDPRAISKLYSKLSPRGEATTTEEKRAAIVEAVGKMELDPQVTRRTLGAEHANVSKDVLLAATRKLLAVNRGEADPDDRDALPYQRLVGPEDIFAEQLSKAKGVARKLLWKAAARGNLDHVQPGAYDDAMKHALMSTGLGTPLEEINPADTFDQQVRVTRMGEGGIPSLDAVPDESRAVQPSQFGFVDFLRTPESGKVGVDMRLARAAKKGADGNLYTPVIGKDGKEVYKTPQDLADAVLAFPGELRRGEPVVAALVNGKVEMVPRGKVDYSVPSMENTFSPLGNMIPMKSMVKGQRAVMAARMLTQALPIRDAEAPWVQSGIPGQPGRSYEREYGEKLGARMSAAAGTVDSVSPTDITVRDREGNLHHTELYDHFPFNRKTFISNRPVVKPGDRVDAGQLLAASNYTNGEGVTALGKNARVAYIPWGGLNFEDANVISRSFAEKMSSEHMYQHGHEWEDTDKRGLKAFKSIFPAAYDRKTLEGFDDDGLIKPGTEVKQGSPLALIARERPRNRKSLHRRRAPSYTNETITWDHHTPGIVTDVEATDKGFAVVVKSTVPMEEGDKLSGRYGDKGIISRIVPDEQMPTDKDGRPFEVLLNPLGITSRTNPAQIVEAALGKVAEIRGEPIAVPDFEDEEDMVEFALRELQKAGVEDVSSIIDPSNDRRVDDVFTGNRWFMKLHHTSESKNQGRGLGAYTADQQPARGGPEGAKRVGMLEVNALLSHGATDVVRDASQVRGQANPDYWRQKMSGNKPPTPHVPHTYKKFVSYLKAAGVNVVRDGPRLHIMAMTGKGIDELTQGRELKSVETVDWKTMEPVKGGLFDETLTGGHFTNEGGGNRWAHIKLHEPMPNPVMEEPIRRVLGLTKPKFQDILAGKEKLNGKIGPAAIASALGNINLDKELARTREEIKGEKKVARDAAIRRLGYLKDTQRLGIHPREWMLDKVPVLPPAFRPVSTMGAKKLPLVADANYLYKEVFDANQGLRDMAGQLDDQDLGEERLAVYNAFKAVTGLGDPTHPKNQERQVKGLLKHVFGKSPKLGMVQRRLLGSTVDMVGRAVIAPDPDLDMDQVGIPEPRAWDIYEPLVIRSLVRRGVPGREAASAVKERSTIAREALIKEMEARPVIINRAPTLHKYGMMAAWPRLVKGDVMRISPLVVGGFNADFDGDAMAFHVPGDDDAAQEAAEKMLPSRNLYSAANFRVHYTPSQEYTGGIYEASARIDKQNKPVVFATIQDAIKAYRQGKINLDRRIEIIGT